MPFMFLWNTIDIERLAGELSAASTHDSISHYNRRRAATGYSNRKSPFRGFFVILFGHATLLGKTENFHIASVEIII